VKNTTKYYVNKSIANASVISYIEDSLKGRNLKERKSKMSASKTSKHNGHMLALQDDQDIKATRRARANESRLYRGGRDSDSTIRMINATGGISNMAQERWRNLTPNLSKPFAYRTMPLSTVNYARSKSAGTSVGWSSSWVVVGATCPWSHDVKPTSVGMLTLDGIADVLNGFIKPHHKSGYRTIGKVKPMA